MKTKLIKANIITAAIGVIASISLNQYLFALSFQWALIYSLTELNNNQDGDQ